MRCLHCGKQLSLLRRASGSEFCSRAHEQKYVEEQESLAIARLIESKREALAAQAQRGAKRHKQRPHAAPDLVEKFFPLAPRSRPAARADWRFPAPLEAQTAAVFPQAGLRVLRDFCTPGWANLQVLALELRGDRRPAPAEAGAAPALRPAPPALPEDENRVLPSGCAMRLADFESVTPALADTCPSPSAATQGILAPPKMEFPDGPASLRAAWPRVAGPSSVVEELTPVPGKTPSRHQPPDAVLRLPERAAYPGAGLSPAPPQKTPAFKTDPPAAGFLVRIGLSADSRRPPDIVEERLVAPIVPLRLVLAQTPCSVPEAGAIGQELAAVGVQPIPCLEVAEEAPPPRRHALPESDFRTVLASLGSAPLEPASGFPAVAMNGNGVRPVPAGGALEACSPWRIPGIETPTAPGVSRAPQLGCAESLAPTGPTTDLSECAAAVWRPAQNEPVPLQDIPAQPVAEMRTPLAPCQDLDVDPQPPAALLAAGLDHILAKEDHTQPQSLCQPASVVPRPWLPAANLTPVAPAQPVEAAPPPGSRWRNTWGTLAARYRSAPGVVKWVAVALPLFVAPLLRFPGETATATSEAREGNQVVAGRQLDSWQQAIAKRAAIRLEDDFRSGLAAWKGTGNWADTWSYDPAGLVLVGKLALYGPSLELSDYRMEFTGQLARGGMGWAFRARDDRNYHAMKLAIVEPGPLSKAVLLHYSVVEGKAGARSRSPLPFLLGQKTMRQVRVDVRGENFTIYVDGQLVNYWADQRLLSGGIGFFAESGDQFRLRWVGVTHQDDVLGRLCALLAPPGHTAKESLKQ